MKRSLTISLAVAGVLLALSATAESPFANLTPEALWEQAKIRFFPLPAEAPSPDNPLSDAKVELGKTLYYARHDQYQQQLDHAFLPVDPTWVNDPLAGSLANQVAVQVPVPPVVSRTTRMSMPPP